MKLPSILFALSVAAVGCSSNSEPSGNTLHPASLPAKTNTCPRTVEAAVGFKCSTEGYTCAIGFPCGQFLSEQAKCTCQSGTYVCYNLNGEPLGDDPTAACVARNNGHDSECPTASPGQTKATCKTPGLACNYKGPVCTGVDDVSATETCICQGSSLPDGTIGPLQYRCEPGYCY